MNTSTFQTFEKESRSEGFDEVLERKWAASSTVDTHTHPFAVSAVIAEGEMWLKVGDEERHLGPGDTFTLDRQIPHSEKYGPQGTTLWVARRHTP